MVRLLSMTALPVWAFLLFAAAPPVPPKTSPRVPLTTSRVVGSPDAPPPYRTRRVFAQQSLKLPVYLTSHPAHDLLFVVEQNGKIVHFSPKGDKTTEFVQLPDADTYSMTFHPKYATNKLVYVFSNGPNSKPKKKNQIWQYRVSGDSPRCDPATRKLIIEWESNGHNGGDLGFGADGMLYLTSGDGTSDSDGDNTGQDLRDLCSGLIRIDVDGAPAGKGYAVPKDNPFLKVPGARPELWAFGLRNPWRMSFDAKTNDLYIGDVGQDLWEMIHLGKRGANYGWSVREGSHPFYLTRKQGPAPLVAPLIEHPHSESRSITGGLVYRGKKFRDLVGAYIYGDYSTGKIWALRQKAGKVTWKKELALTRLQIVGFGADREGELYVVDLTGQIHQLEPAPAITAKNTFPRKLSESGLFRSVARYEVQPALVPYSVNAQLWSDGAHKERHLALPGFETVAFSEKSFWTFPEQTVLVKTFALDLADGTRKRVETRFLTLQDKEWFGYSYAWNDDQTDALLVEAPGRDRTYLVRDPKAKDGKSDLAWHYPSRVECMVCHSRAANYVLGLTTRQINREIDCGGTRENQLAVMERLGVFRGSKSEQWKPIDEQAAGLGQLGRVALRLTLPKILRQPRIGVGDQLTTKLTKRREQLAEVSRKGDTKSLPKLPAQMPRLADPDDEKAEISSRVRAYLHSNCAHCHVWAGGGNAAMLLDADTATDKMKLLRERPLHDKFGIADAFLVAPGSPEKSVLVHRLAHRGRGQMPPLASARVDEKAVRLFEAWIKGMK